MPPRRDDSATVNLKLRVKEPMRAAIEKSAEDRGVSMNTEINDRLEKSFSSGTMLDEALAIAHGPDLAKILKAMAVAMNSAGRMVMLNRFFADRKPRQLEIDWTRVPAAYDAAVQIGREILDAAKPPAEMGHDQFLTIDPAGMTDFLDDCLQRLADRLHKRRAEPPAVAPSKAFVWKKFALSDGSTVKPKRR